MVSRRRVLEGLTAATLSLASGWLGGAGETKTKVNADPEQENLVNLLRDTPREQLLEALLEPSKTIAPEYRLWTVETEDGEVHTGFRVDDGGENSNQPVGGLRLATGQVLELAADQVVSEKPQPLSPMPEGLLNFLTEQEVADLVEFLRSRKTP